MILLGIITNTTLVFLIKENLKNSIYRWPILFAVENVLILLYFIISYGHLPCWFDYIEQIRYAYILKVIKNDFRYHDPKKIKDNNSNISII